MSGRTRPEHRTTLPVDMRKATVATMWWVAQQLGAGWNVELRYATPKLAAASVRELRSTRRRYAVKRDGDKVTIGHRKDGR